MNKIGFKTFFDPSLSCRHLVGWLIILLALIIPHYVEGQVRSGGAFLKILPGARSQGMAASLTGSIDEMYAIYANPGAVGFLREWQWSSSYTEWFADVYSLSSMYGRHLNTPWSSRTKIALGIQYQGVREFNSTNQANAVASANDFIVTASFGNPLTLLSKNLSIGTNVKYFRSALGNFTASSVLFDVGLLYRSNRFKLPNGLFDYGILSAGMSVNHVGNSLKFISAETPLPRTLRAGIGINLGKHDGAQVKLTADYRKVRDEQGGLGFGTEVSWRYGVALRGGYNFNDNFLSKFSFGLSFRLDDRASPVRAVLPGRNSAMRVDVAGLEKNEFFSTSFQGTMNLYPIGPEEFSFAEPYLEEQTRPKEVILSWEESRDPDLFDEVNYLLLISRNLNDEEDSEKLREVIAKIEMKREKLLEVTNQSKSPSFWAINSGFVKDLKKEHVHYVTDELAEGHYSWTVLAYDKDKHIRFVENKTRRIRQFEILPVLEIADIRFDYDKWITEEPYQGELRISVKNKGKTTAQNDILTVHDFFLDGGRRFASEFSEKDIATIDSLPGELAWTFESIVLDGLRAGADTTITLKWNTELNGAHRITASVGRRQPTGEKPRSSISTSSVFHTIPKGSFQAPEYVVAAIDSVYQYELPFISKIFFDKHSADLRIKKTSLMYSPLETLVNRLAEKTNVKLQLRGYVDGTLEESEALIIERAEVVRNEILRLGVPDSLIEIPREIRADQVNHKPNRHSDPDWRWVEQERRYVKITAHEIGKEGEEVVDLFHSVPLTLPKSRSLLPVQFVSTISGTVPLASGRVQLQAGERQVGLEDFRFSPQNPDTMTWHHYADGIEWLNKSVDYAVSIEDSLGRKFYTKQRSVVLRPLKHNFLPDKIIVGVSDFTQEKPSHNLYWSRIIERMTERLETNANLHFQFVGHACEIGTHAVNDSLSVKRARKFQKQFLAATHERLPYLFDEIDSRLQVSQGRGKREPFHFEIEKNNFLFVIRNKSQKEYHDIVKQIDQGKKTIKFAPFILEIGDDKIKLISDNSTTFGRQINRRIEILIRSLPGTKFSTF